MNAPNTFMLALALGGKLNDVLRFINVLQFHVCSVSTTIILTDAQKLYIILDPGDKCSDQPIAGAKQMFQGS